MGIEFNKLLKGNRKKVGITQEKLAEKIKLERTYMSKLESTKSNPSFSTIEKLCEGLGMTPVEFFGGVESKTKEPALIIYKDKDEKIKSESYRIKGELTPIKVVRDLAAFSSKRKITKEFASKYIFIEKDMFPHPEDIIGYEVEPEFKTRSFSLKKSILLINFIDRDIDHRYYYVVEPIDKDANLMDIHIALIDDAVSHYAFYDPYKEDEDIPGFPKLHYAYKKEEFEPDIIRGKVVGVIGKL